jgi:hypothetical protein
VDERYGIFLREAAGSKPNPPGLFGEAKDVVREVFPEIQELPGYEIERLQGAIVAGFHHTELARLVHFRLGRRLDEITSSVSLTDAVYDVIMWSQRHGRTGDLVRAIQQERPQHQAIQEVTGSLLDQDCTGDRRQHSTRAVEIRAFTMEKLSGLEAERQQLLAKRDKDLPECAGDESVDKARLAEIEAERARAVAIELLKHFHQIGCKLSAHAEKTVEAVLGPFTGRSDP